MGVTRRIAIRSAALIATGSLLAGLAALPAWGQEAKQLYEETCGPCHGASGKGDGPSGQFLQPKPADFFTVLQGKDDAYIAKVISEGGAGVGKSPLMPAYKGVFSDEQLKELVQYLKGLAAKQ
ncbi:MAG: cytochrome c [Deltaproteobacteria bacterium]|nr:cytochrome c [Deltaproteobacteria bacterium]